MFPVYRVRSSLWTNSLAHPLKDRQPHGARCCHCPCCFRGGSLGSAAAFQHLLSRKGWRERMLGDGPPARAPGGWPCPGTSSSILGSLGLPNLRSRSSLLWPAGHILGLPCTPRVGVLHPHGTSSPLCISAHPCFRIKHKSKGGRNAKRQRGGVV